MFSRFTSPTHEPYSRYINEGLGETSFFREQLYPFLSLDQSFHPAFEFSCTLSDISITLLDILVSIHHSSHTTTIHYEPTHSHANLNFSSSHPTNTSLSITYSQSLVRAGSAVTAMNLTLSPRSWPVTSSFVDITSQPSTLLLIVHFFEPCLRSIFSHPLRNSPFPVSPHLPIFPSARQCTMLRDF